jgi:hypothetical protein
MFDNYSRAAMQAMLLARLEAGKVGSEAMDTEHILLAFVRLADTFIASIVMVKRRRFDLLCLQRERGLSDAALSFSARSCHTGNHFRSSFRDSLGETLGV